MLVGIGGFYPFFPVMSRLSLRRRMRCVVMSNDDDGADNGVGDGLCYTILYSHERWHMMAKDSDGNSSL